MGIVEWAEWVGRDHTTVSRQINKPESPGLVARVASAEDGRVRAVFMTEQGCVMTDALDSARQKIIEKMLSLWDKDDVRTLARLLRRAADDALDGVKTL